MKKIKEIYMVRWNSKTIIEVFDNLESALACKEDMERISEKIGVSGDYYSIYTRALENTYSPVSDKYSKIA